MSYSWNHRTIRICLYVSKNQLFGILIGIVLNLYTKWKKNQLGKIDIFTTVILLSLKHIFILLFAFIWIFFDSLWEFCNLLHIDLAHDLIDLYLCFRVFFYVNGAVSLFLNSNCSLPVYRKELDYSVLIYPETLL